MILYDFNIYAYKKSAILGAVIISYRIDKGNVFYSIVTSHIKSRRQERNDR